jgi:hypothetical protein
MRAFARIPSCGLTGLDSMSQLGATAAESASVGAVGSVAQLESANAISRTARMDRVRSMMDLQWGEREREAFSIHGAVTLRAKML